MRSGTPRNCLTDLELILYILIALCCFIVYDNGCRSRWLKKGSGVPAPLARYSLGSLDGK